MIFFIHRLLPVITVLIFLFCACKKKTTASCDDSNTSLYRSDFRVGVATNVELLQSNLVYRNIVVEQFNIILPENAYLLSRIHPGENTFNFTEFDYLADFCKTYNKHMEGANLIYQLYLPAWINDFKGDRDAWEELTRKHIQTVVGRYKGIVESWMVVNEALNEDGSLADNVWRQHIGDTYIEKFFQWAHEADPDAALFYNDFNLENNHLKLASALDLAEMLRGRGLRIDGIGMQMHNQVNFPSPDEVSRAAQKIVDRQFQVYFSEWDISFNQLKNKTALTNDMKEQQKYLIKTMVKGFKQLPAKFRHGISFWGVGDADSWIRPQFSRIDWPLLYDDNYKPKPAYCGFIEAINEPL